jgi:hypothetical protein
MSFLITLLYITVDKASLNEYVVALSGQWLACLPLDPRFVCLNPAKDDGFLRAI